MSLIDKIVSWDQARAFAQMSRKDNKTIVFTNGCFDLLHPGHVLYLEEARTLGDELIVGLNSDTSVKILKGPTRPIQDQRARATVLSALSSVSRVVIFTEETPKRLIESLSPDILVKGGDYQIDEIVGAQHVLATGGEVKVLSFHDGHRKSRSVKRMGGGDGGI